LWQTKEVWTDFGARANNGTKAQSVKGAIPAKVSQC
jgi:hypothetical protein